MRSRINSTSRKRITAEMVAFSLESKDDGTTEFQARIDLSDLDLPNSGEVVVEAYRQSLHERFSFGTVGLVGAREDTVLRELDPRAVSFRVKVVEPTTGRLLARGDKLGASDSAEGGRHELLKVVVRELGHEPWRTEIYEDQKPVLALNDHIPDALGRIQTDTQFQALILPAALRQVLLMLSIERQEEDEDEDHWANDWLQFASAISGREKPDWDNSLAIWQWVDAVCQSFSTHFSMMARLVREDEIMTTLRRLTADGRARFREWLAQGAPGSAPGNLLSDDGPSEAVQGLASIEKRSFGSRQELGSYLCKQLDGLSASAIRFDVGIWDWLSLFYIDELLPLGDHDKREVKQIYRYALELKNRLWSRHIVRMSWMAVRDHGVFARVMLAFPISKQPETLEQLGGQQEAFGARAVVEAADRLYWDPTANALKRGAQGKKEGTPRRLVRFMRQFRRTFDPPAMTADQLLATLPKEFGRWQPERPAGTP